VTASELRQLRRRLRLSQARFADLVGVAANTVARWERGEMMMQPAMDRLVRLTVMKPGRKRAVTHKRP